MPKYTTDDDLELLGELGVDIAPKPSGQRSAREERIIAGFEEIERFVEEHGRPPEHGEDRDIFERLYAVRLDRLRETEECREVLRPLDSRGILDAGDHASLATENPLDETLLAALGVEADSNNDVTQLTHVRSRREIKAAEEIAQRTVCPDFDEFKPIFEKVQCELEAGERPGQTHTQNGRIEGHNSGA